MTNRVFFYASGIFSISLYLFFFLLFVLYVKSHNVQKIDAFVKKDTVLEFDIVLDIQNKQEKVIKKITKENKKSQEIVKKSTSANVKTTGDIQSLFANVNTNSNEVLKEVVNNTEKSITTSRFKSKFEKQAKSDNVSISKLLDNVQNASNLKLVVSDAQDKNDPYYSKIYEILSTNWSPQVVIDELFAKVLISILKDGSFEFKFLQYSGNSSFDENLQNFLMQQMQNPFPPHNKGNRANIEIIFKSKE